MTIMILNLFFIVCTLALVAFVISAWRIASGVIRQPREVLHEDWNTAGLHPEFVRFASADGTSLAGAFLRGTNRATIVLLHGYGDSKTQLLPQAKFLLAEGFNIFLFDFRASGESDGEYITLGLDEQQDLAGAICYLHTRKDIDHGRIGVFGFSMGGSVALLKAGDLPEIRAVAVDSSYAEVKSVIQANFREYLGRFTFFPLGTLVLYIIKVRTGAYLSDIRPLKHMHRLHDIPLLFIHGTKDVTVPVWDAMRMQGSATGPTDMFIIEGAGHHTTRAMAGEQYTKKLVGFFRTHLLD